jgi:outer membrane lipoprotein-sorting protein
MGSVLARNRRWAVPFATLAAISGIGVVGNLAQAGADVPTLPGLSATELIAKARAADVKALSGTLELTSNLGLPSIGALSDSLGGSSTATLSSLVAGTHTAKVWFNGPDQVRVTTAKPLAETNWVRNGVDVWSYDSTSGRATHVALPPAASEGASAQKDPAETGPEQTPMQLAQKLLDDVTPSTEVRVDTPRYVDGRPVYELVLAPKSAASTVGDAVISVDAATGLPLAVRIDAKSDASHAAFRLGFRHISFSTPAPSVFDFTAPPGATVVQASSPMELVNPVHRHGRRDRERDKTMAPESPPTSSGAEVTTVGEDWTRVAVLPASAVPAPVTGLLSNGAPVTVAGLHGRLTTTKLVNAILLDDGRLLVGAVRPDALEAALPAS